MPITALLAPLLAVLLAAAVAASTPAVLRRLPVPPDEEEGLPPFSDLATPGFRTGVFCTAAVAGTIAFSCLPATDWPAWAGLVSLGALLGLIDLRTTFLPLRLTYLTLALAVTGAGITAWLRADVWVVVTAGAAGLCAAAFFWLVWRFSNGLGFGDVRLAAVIGVVTGTVGAPFALWSFLLGTATGAIWGIVLRWRRGASEPFAYGPALLVGPLLALLVRRLVLPG